MTKEEMRLRLRCERDRNRKLVKECAIAWALVARHKKAGEIARRHLTDLSASAPTLFTPEQAPVQEFVRRALEAMDKAIKERRR